MIWIIVLIIIIVLFTLFIFTNIIYNKFQDYIIKINEVEGKIDESLRNKYDVLIKLNNSIKEIIKTDKDLVDDLEKLKDQDKSSFEIHRILIEKYGKLEYIKKQYKEITKSEDINKMFYEIDDIDESLHAYIKFYNENITEYNVYVRKLPYNILAIILKYKEKPFFDNKDLSDEKIDDFKL